MLSWIETLIQDIKFGMRILARDRSFAATAILVLGLGIGVNNMLCTIIYGHTLRGLPIERADRVLYISTFDDRVADRALSYLDFDDVRRANTFAGIAAFVSAPVTLGDDGRAPDRLTASYVSANAFALLGIEPLIGRSMSPSEDIAGAPLVALLGNNTWKSRYGSDPSIVERQTLVNGTHATIIGVVPDRSGFPSTAEVWLPLNRGPGVDVQKRDARTLRVFGRVRDDVALTDARGEIESIINRIALENPDSSRNLRARLTPISRRFLGDPTHPGWLAFITAGFLVLAVSCANVANLLLSRAVLRAREFAVRGSLGATRRRIVRQLLVESALLALLAGALGLGTSLAGVRIFAAAIPQDVLPYWLNYTMDGRVFAALVLVSFGAVLLFGLVPALQTSKIDVNRVLKMGGRTSTIGTRRLTTAFLAAEFALTIVLLSEALAAYRNAAPDVPSDDAIDTPNLVTAAITLPGDKYRTSEQRGAFFRRLDEQLAADAARLTHAVASDLPRHNATEQVLEVEGQTFDVTQARPTVWTVAIGPRYFSTLGVALERGRDFSEGDGQPGHEHVIVNERFRERFFPQQDLLGRRIRVRLASASQATSEWRTIIAVTRDIRHRPQSPVDPIVYLPLYAASPSTAFLIVRSAFSIEATAATLRQHVFGVDPLVPLYRITLLNRAIADVEWNARVSMQLIVTLIIITTTFSLVGLYAVTAHAVNQRTPEIGLRIALGARPQHVQWVVLRGAMFQVTLGLLVGIAGTIVWDAIFESGQLNLRVASPGNLMPIAVLLVCVTFAACVVPVRRAIRLNPVAALREE